MCFHGVFPLVADPRFRNPAGYFTGRQERDAKMAEVMEAECLSGHSWHFGKKDIAASVGGFGMKLFHQVSDVGGKMPDRFDAFRVLPHLARQPAEDHVPVR